MNRSLTLLPLLLAGCASITPVPWTAQPGRIADPRAEVKALILANTTSGCVTTPDFNETMLTVKFVCSNGVGNSVVRFDRVESIVLQQYGEWYRVLLHHKGGAEDFSWTSKSLDDIQRLADALSALAKPSGAAPAKDTSSL